MWIPCKRVSRSWTQLAAGTAVVYPIVFADRLELLVSLPNGLKRLSIPVSSATLTQEVRAFRKTVEKRTTREYLPHAQQLYAWLIRPLEPDLASFRIDTLVFVPDGPLRTVPMAALHDGRQFLIEKFALATTPGTESHRPEADRPREGPAVCRAGSRERFKDFPPSLRRRRDQCHSHALPGGSTLECRVFDSAS